MNIPQILDPKLLVFFVPPIFVLLFILLQIFKVEHVARVNKLHVIISSQTGSQRTLSVVQNIFTLNSKDS